MQYTAEFCESVAKTDANIAITAWLQKGKAVAWHVALEIPIPAEDKQETMGVQAELIRSILKTNEDYFGKTRYIMHSQENADVFAFFVDDADYMFTLVIMRPYSYDGLVRQVMDRLAIG